MSYPASKKTYDLTICNQPYPFLDRIIDGSKVIEGRTNSPFFQKMQVGEVLKLYNREKWALCQITALRPYDTFQEMLAAETLPRVLPDFPDINKAVAMYHQFPRFIENEQKYGVVAIELNKIQSGFYESSKKGGNAY